MNALSFLWTLRLTHTLRSYGWLFMAGVQLSSPFSYAAELPSWWAERGLIDPTQMEDDFAPVNVGQLKSVASRAAEEMSDRLPGISSPDIDSLTKSWLSWLPNPDWDDFAAVNVGQLKAVAKPFYARLIESEVVPSFPWSETDPERDDFAPANIGQLKNLFAFDLDVDTDGDYIRDVVEQFVGTDVSIADASGDADEDAVSNWNEILAGTRVDSSLANAADLDWHELQWNVLDSTTSSDEPGLGSNLAVAAPATGGSAWSHQALLRHGGIRLLVPDRFATLSVGFSSAVNSPTVAWGVSLLGDGKLNVITGGPSNPPPVAVRNGDVITIKRSRGMSHILVNGRSLVSGHTISSPQRLTPVCLLSSAASQVIRCQMTGLELDADEDGMADTWELEMLVRLGLNQAAIEDFLPTGDADNDGVNNLAEFLAGLEAWKPDSNDDGIPDIYSVDTTDADGDGIPAGIETYWALSDLNPEDSWEDLDGDGLSNLTEHLAGLSLNNPSERLDTDGDGMSDHFEDFYGLNKHFFKDAVHDNDRDGVLNFEEALHALDPFNTKSRSGNPASDYEIAVLPHLSDGTLTHPVAMNDWDNDGAENWKEHLVNRVRQIQAAAAELPPPTPADLLNLRGADMALDHDGDGILTGTEISQGLNPLSEDTDGDGVSDLFDPTPGSIEGNFAGFLDGPIFEAYSYPYGRHFRKQGLTVQITHGTTWVGPSSDLTWYFDENSGLFRAILPLIGAYPPATANPIFNTSGPTWYVNELNRRFRSYNARDAHPLAWFGGPQGYQYGGAIPAVYQRLWHGGLVVQRPIDFRVFSRVAPKENEPLGRFWVWSVNFINPPADAAPEHPLPLTPPASSLVEVNAGPDRYTATHLENAVTFNASAGTSGALSQGVLHWPVPMGQIPDYIFKMPNATSGSELVEGFPGVIPGVPFPYPLVTVEHNDPENYQQITATHRPIVTITSKGPGSLRLWAIRHKGNPALQESHQILLSDATHENDLIELPFTPEVTYWIEPLTPGPITLTYRAKARHNDAELVKDYSSIIVALPEIEEVISDQLADSGCNKLPTAYFGGNPNKPCNGNPNNPMLMATRYGQTAKLKIKMAAADPKVFVGAREINTTSILGSASASVEKFDLEFTVPTTSTTGLYEIVAGYDINSNLKLDPQEVKVVYEKTPRTDKDGNPSTKDLHLIDKVKVIDKTQFDTSLAELIWYTQPSATGFAGDLLAAFANGTNVIPGATTLADVITSSTEGLSHPLGAKWNTNCHADTHRFVFPKESEASEAINNSGGMWNLFVQVINNHISELITYAGAETGTVISYPISFTDYSVNFAETDETSNVRIAIGKCLFSGEITVIYRVIGATQIEVERVELVNGKCIDLYDWAWGAKPLTVFNFVVADPKHGAFVQAGHATLATGDSGKVFFTEFLLETSSTYGVPYPVFPHALPPDPCNP